MQVISPLADFDFPQWMQGLREKGVKPATAMKLYDELRLFGHGAARQDPVSKANEQWDQMRVRYCDKLRSIDSEAGWKDYLEKEPFLIFGFEKVKQEDRISFLTPWILSDNHSRINKEDMINRIMASRRYNLPEQWKLWDDMGMEWEDVEAAMSHDRTSQPHHKASAKDNALLERALSETGLAGLEWGSIHASDPEFVRNLAHNAIDANTQLCKRSGWEGGVLGLNGKVTLGIGMPTDGVGGWCISNQDSDGSRIACTPHVGWGAVSHEWLHSLDFSMGYDPKNREANEMASHQGKEPWKQLVQQLRSHENAPEVAKIVHQELIDGFVRRWEDPALPEAVKDTVYAIRQERQSGPQDQPDRKAQKTRLANAYGGELGPLRAEVALTELEIMEQHEQTMANKGSIWIQFAERFDQNIAKYASKAHAKEWKGYFKECSEQAAHSFEATFAEGQCFITDVDPERSSLRYPLPSEALSQQLTWRRFFKQAAQWWQQDNQHALNAAVEDAPKLSMAARLDDRRGGSKQGEAVPEKIRPAPR